MLFNREGFKLWWIHPNAARAPGTRTHPRFKVMPYNKAVWEAGPAPLAWEIGLVRDRVAAAASAARAAVPCPKRVHYAPRLKAEAPTA